MCAVIHYLDTPSFTMVLNAYFLFLSLKLPCCSLFILKNKHSHWFPQFTEHLKFRTSSNIPPKCSADIQTDPKQVKYKN